MTDADIDTMPEPGYNIGNAACVVANSGLFTAAAVKMARLALAEHERAEALARRVAELEAARQWIPHDGDGQPVDAAVWVRYRNGDECGPMYASGLCWDHIGPQYEDGETDIVAYRTTDPNAETGEEAANADD